MAMSLLDGHDLPFYSFKLYLLYTVCIFHIDVVHLFTCVILPDVTALAAKHKYIWKHAFMVVHKQYDNDNSVT